MDRRTFIKATAAGSALAALGPRLATAADEGIDIEAAKKEGTVTLYTAHFDTQTSQQLGEAFTKQYGIKANVVRTTAQVAYQRLTQDMKSGITECDVFSSTDVGHFVRLKPQNVFLQWTPPNAAHVIEAFKGLDPDNVYFTTSAGLVLINYNTEKAKPADAPKRWTDLYDPKWKDQVTVGHPGYSGYVGTWVVLMRKLYGWDYFEKLAKNNPQIGRSINDTVTMLNSGERSVGAGPEATTLESAHRGNPLAVNYPEDGTLLMIAPSAIMKHSKRPNAAKLMMNFLMSKEAMQVIVANFGDSIVPGVAPAPGAKPLDQVKTIRPSIEEIAAGIPEVIKQWRDTFGV